MKIAVVQLTVSESKQENLAKAPVYIAKAKREGADLVLFPEGFMAIIPIDSSTLHAEVAEVLLFRRSPQKQTNTASMWCVVFLNQKKVIASVRKHDCAS